MKTDTRRRNKTVAFRKMHGIGNDFVLFDGVTGPLPDVDLSSLSTSMCDRRFGVGADGLITVERAGGDEFAMRMYNPDGSESEMCGNGIRCVARLLLDAEIVTPSLTLPQGRGIPVHTGAGLLVLHPTDDGRVRVDMGRALLTRGEIGMSGKPDETFIGKPIDVPLTPNPSPSEGRGGFLGTAVSMGNPHLVLIVTSHESPVTSGPATGASPRNNTFEERGLGEIDLHAWGPVLEHHELFPNRVNVHFVQVLDRGHIVQRTWERGAGITLACGTGACASAVACFLNGLTERVVDVDLPGGRLKIEYAEDGHVFMTGPVESVFDGEWSL